ncbi:MAG TPA: cob(I)yrinic acid a,c-diamide adenosyltransferase [Clostridiales bacterium]|nr:cob(I)yrinic acid a,c-diamide adenosyltransferase [Clostridiales bacterium]
MAPLDKGLVHIYCGNGKGKTTAAVGLGVRACGRGLKVLMVQFLKDGDTGELMSLTNLGENFRVIAGESTPKFTFQMSPEEKAQAAKVQLRNFELVLQMLQKESFDMLILDEIMAAVRQGMIPEDRVAELIQNRPAHMEMVLTGRNPPDRLIALADYVSEIRMIKHPFREGTPARVGIER